MFLIYYILLLFHWPEVPQLVGTLTNIRKPLVSNPTLSSAWHLGPYPLDFH